MPRRHGKLLEQLTAFHVATISGGTILTLWGVIEIFLRVDPFLFLYFKHLWWLGVPLVTLSVTSIILIFLGKYEERTLFEHSSKFRILEQLCLLLAPLFLTIILFYLHNNNLFFANNNFDSSPISEVVLLLIVLIVSTIICTYFLIGSISLDQTNPEIRDSRPVTAKGKQKPAWYDLPLLVPVLVVGVAMIALANGRAKEITRGDIAQEELRQAGLSFSMESLQSAMYLVSPRSVELFRLAEVNRQDLLTALGGPTEFTEGKPLVTSAMERLNPTYLGCIHHSSSDNAGDIDNEQCQRIEEFLDFFRMSNGATDDQARTSFCEEVGAPIPISQDLHDGLPDRTLLSHALTGLHLDIALLIVKDCGWPNPLDVLRPPNETETQQHNVTGLQFNELYIDYLRSVIDPVSLVLNNYRQASNKNKPNTLKMLVDFCDFEILNKYEIQYRSLIDRSFSDAEFNNITSSGENTDAKILSECLQVINDNVNNTSNNQSLRIQRLQAAARTPNECLYLEHFVDSNSLEKNTTSVNLLYQTTRTAQRAPVRTLQAQGARHLISRNTSVSSSKSDAPGLQIVSIFPDALDDFMAALDYDNALKHRPDRLLLFYEEKNEVPASVIFVGAEGGYLRLEAISGNDNIFATGSLGLSIHKEHLNSDRQSYVNISPDNMPNSEVKSDGIFNKHFIDVPSANGLNVDIDESSDIIEGCYYLIRESDDQSSTIISNSQINSEAPAYIPGVNPGKYSLSLFSNQSFNFGKTASIGLIPNDILPCTVYDSFNERENIIASNNQRVDTDYKNSAIFRKSSIVSLLNSQTVFCDFSIDHNTDDRYIYVDIRATTDIVHFMIPIPDSNERTFDQEFNNTLQIDSDLSGILFSQEEYVNYENSEFSLKNVSSGNYMLAIRQLNFDPSLNRTEEIEAKAVVRLAFAELVKHEQVTSNSLSFQVENNEISFELDPSDYDLEEANIIEISLSCLVADIDILVDGNGIYASSSKSRTEDDVVSVPNGENPIDITLSLNGNDPDFCLKVRGFRFLPLD